VVVTWETAAVESTAALLATLNAYATEGGLDGRYEPATCFNPMIALGHYPAPGDALSLWAGYERLLQSANDHGVRHVQLNLSWARLEPREGSFDDEAFARYQSVISEAQRCGLRVGIGTGDGAWPAWLGLEPWVWPWTTPVTLRFLSRIHDAFSHADAIVAVPSPDELLPGFLHRSGPPWRSGAHEDARVAKDNLSAVLDEAAQRGYLRPWGETFATTRALVAGRGPLSQPHPLLRRAGDDWVLVD